MVRQVAVTFLRVLGMTKKYLGTRIGAGWADLARIFWSSLWHVIIGFGNEHLIFNEIIDQIQPFGSGKTH